MGQKDYKTVLQEKLQIHGNVKIEYILLKSKGPDHDKTFVVEVKCDGKSLAIRRRKNKKNGRNGCCKQGSRRKNMKKKEEYIIPIFVPHLGCPNDCTFCNQKSISGQNKQVTAKEVKNIIEEYLKSFKDNNIYKEVAFFGGSFTGIEKEKQEELLKAAYEFVKNKKINSIRLSTRPDYIDKEELKLLKKYGVKTIELGVQSTNDYILKKCKRGHTFEDVKKASKLIRRHGFTLGHQMMIGLPESTKLDELNTAKDLAKLKPKIVRLYPVLVIKNTELEKEYLRKEYEPLTVLQAVERCKELYYFFNKKKITVIRMGLQSTDLICNPENDKSEVVARTISRGIWTTCRRWHLV